MDALCMQGKTVLVTGAGKAGSLGQAVALAFARAGANVAACGRKKSRVAQLVSQVEELGAKGLALALPQVDAASAREAAERVDREFGRIDVLVNAQQADHSGAPLARCKERDLELAMRTGLYAALAFLQACYEALRASHGAVIGFASLTGVEGGPHQATLSAAQEALRSLHRTAAAEWSGYGIRVNTVCALAKTAEAAKWEREFPELYEQVLNEVPGGRFAEPDEVAQLCVQLAAGERTGQTLRVDGAGVSVLQEPQWRA